MSLRASYSITHLSLISDMIVGAMRAETRSVLPDSEDARGTLLVNAVGFRSSCLPIDEGFGVEQVLEFGFVGGGGG
jgi:hypothetical protein